MKKHRRRLRDRKRDFQVISQAALREVAIKVTREKIKGATENVPSHGRVPSRIGNNPIGRPEEAEGVVRGEVDLGLGLDGKQRWGRTCAALQPRSCLTVCP